MATLPGAPFLYPIVDVAALDGRAVGAAVAALGRGGVRMVQFRGKGLEDRPFLALAREALQAARAAGTLLIVNDRVDVARILGADGVHLGQEDLPARLAREVLPPGALVGVSTHSIDQLEALRGEPVDYIALGPIFPTPSKEKPDPVVGLEMLVRAHAGTAKPLVAIGGITAATAASVVAAGAYGVAVISGLLRQPDLEAAARALEAALRAPARVR